MMNRTSSSAGLALINPLRTQWYSRRGDPVDPPATPLDSVRVIVDLVEEAHVCIKVPGIVGRDRKSFIDGQLQALLPDVPLKGTWMATSRHPLLPKPFSLHAMGVASPALTQQLEEMCLATHPIDGVWSLSYLMAKWAAGQDLLSGVDWALLCLSMPHGMRLVLLHKATPVFTRLLLITDATALAQEVSQTLKYLVDNRIMERDVRALIVPMDAAAEFVQDLQRAGLTLRPPVVSQRPGGMLVEVMMLAGPAAPGNLADLRLRRYHLANRARTWVRALTAGILVAGVAGLLLHARSLLDAKAQADQQRLQAVELAQAAQAIRDDMAGSQINIPLLRLVQAVQTQHLGQAVDPVEQLWLLAGMMNGHPKAHLLRTEQSLSDSPCPDLGANPQEQALTPQAAALTLAWQFDVRPDASLTPRERRALLGSLVKVVQGWTGWVVRTSPERQENDLPLAGGQGAAQGVDQAATDWRWCLVPRSSDKEVSP